jgi:hypothetical protein
MISSRIARTGEHRSLAHPPPVRKVYASQLIPMVGHVRNVLESHGIRCLVKNEFLAGAAGELPPVECWPELWVIDDKQYQEAVAIVSAASLENLVELGERWTCGVCGEGLEGQFTDCWRCGTSRPPRS